jgi:hypothetical protein
VRSVEPLDQCRCDRRFAIAAADAAAMQGGWHNFGVVDYEGIAAAQERWQIAHCAVFKFGRRLRAHYQKPRRIPRRDRAKRDAVLRQREVEQISAHGKTN